MYDRVCILGPEDLDHECDMGTPAIQRQRRGKLGRKAWYLPSGIYFFIHEPWHHGFQMVIGRTSSGDVRGVYKPQFCGSAGNNKYILVLSVATSDISVYLYVIVSYCHAVVVYCMIN